MNKIAHLGQSGDEFSEKNQQSRRIDLTSPTHPVISLSRNSHSFSSRRCAGSELDVPARKPPMTDVAHTDSPALLDRDLSWLEFNRRVLHEAEDERTPLLERLKFLAIVGSNLDEYFMKRIGVER